MLFRALEASAPARSPAPIYHNPSHELRLTARRGQCDVPSPPSEPHALGGAAAASTGQVALP